MRIAAPSVSTRAGYFARSAADGARRVISTATSVRSDPAIVTSATVASIRMAVPGASGRVFASRSVASECTGAGTQIVIASKAAGPRSFTRRIIIWRPTMTVRNDAAPLALAIAVALAVPLGAQTLPSAPIVVADGHLTLGGDVAISFAPSDPGFFNYTDYDESALRLLRLDLTAAFNAGEHIAVLRDVRREHAFAHGLRLALPEAHALYVR